MEGTCWLLQHSCDRAVAQIFKNSLDSTPNVSQVTFYPKLEKCIYVCVGVGLLQLQNGGERMVCKIGTESEVKIKGLVL